MLLFPFGIAFWRLSLSSTAALTAVLPVCLSSVRSPPDQFCPADQSARSSVGSLCRCQQLAPPFSPVRRPCRYPFVSITFVPCGTFGFVSLRIARFYFQTPARLTSAGWLRSTLTLFTGLSAVCSAGLPVRPYVRSTIGFSLLMPILLFSTIVRRFAGIPEQRSSHATSVLASALRSIIRSVVLIAEIHPEVRRRRVSVHPA